MNSGLPSERSTIASLDSGGRESSDGSDAPMDRLGGNDPDLEGVEQRLVVSRLLEILPQREQERMFMRFYEGLTQSEIANRFGISQMQVSRMLTRSLERLRAIVGL